MPNLRVRNSSALTSTASASSRRARSVAISTTAAPPSLGLQNMYDVSGSLTIGALAISPAGTGLRRHACGVIAPLRSALAAISASSLESSP